MPYQLHCSTDVAQLLDVLDEIELLELLDLLDDEIEIELLERELLVTLAMLLDTELRLRELLDVIELELEEAMIPAESPYSKPRPLVPKYKRP